MAVQARRHCFPNAEKLSRRQVPSIKRRMSATAAGNKTPPIGMPRALKISVQYCKVRTSVPKTSYVLRSTRRRIRLSFSTKITKSYVRLFIGRIRVAGSNRFGLNRSSAERFLPAVSTASIPFGPFPNCFG